MGISLQSKTVKNFGATVKGSLVVGDYIYVLSDYLYRCPIDGDGVGTVETLVDIVEPTSIDSDGVYLYISAENRTKIFVVDINTFTVLNSFGEISIHTIKCDTMGFFHAIYNAGSTGARWRIYKYNADLNSLSKVYDRSGGIGGTRTLAILGNKVMVGGGSVVGSATRLFSWDGTTVTELDSNTTKSSFITNSNDSFFSVLNSSLRRYTLDEQDQLVIEWILSIGDSRMLGADGNYIYAPILSSTELKVITHEGSIVDTIDLPDTFSISGEDAPNQVHCGNNRLYVANGTNLYVMRWSVNAQFTVDKTIGSAPLTVNFVVV
ncbi:MAG: hypothetical protein ACOCZ5_01240 [bacterium]